jgi:hypothetical protein
MEKTEIGEESLFLDAPAGPPLLTVVSFWKARGDIASDGDEIRLQAITSGLGLIPYIGDYDPIAPFSQGGYRPTANWPCFGEEIGHPEIMKGSEEKGAMAK